MKPFNIFLSWSQSTSHEIAKTLNILLSEYFENDEVKCWLSEDIPAGGDWYEAIKNALQQADFGVVCFTPENIDSQWLQFEGGALVSSILAKGKHSVPVCPYLFGVRPEHIPKPFSRWQAVTADYEGTKRLFESINSRLEAHQPLSPKRFDTLFDDSWKKCRNKFPTARPSYSMIGQLQEITYSSTRRISSEVKVAVNRCAEFLFVKAYQEFFSNFTVTDGYVNFAAPASTYPHHLLLLLENFRYPVKAIAILDDKENFWQGSIGSEIYKHTPDTSKRVFVFKDRNHLEENFSIFLRHARHYSAYAMSKANLTKGFYEYAYDFSIIGTPETKILARYDTDTTDKIKSNILFTTNPMDIVLHEKIFDEITSNSIAMTMDQAKRITEDQKKSFIESVFAKMTPLPHRSIEMSAYVSVHDYAQFEEDHAYFNEMMGMMLSNFNKLRDAKRPCRVLELGSGTGHFTKRLISSQNVSVTAVEIDWACYLYLKNALEANHVPSDTRNYKLKVVNADSRTFADPDGKAFDFIFSSFADHHIKPTDKALYFDNIKKNLSPEGVLIVGDEFIPSYDSLIEGSFEDAVTRYHNHIIDIAKTNGHDKLVELETAAMKSGLDKVGDFKMQCEEYEQCLRDAGLIFSKEKIGPKNLDDVGGIYVYVIRRPCSTLSKI
ncbi:MAG: methyltransferase domain-containing protein [Methanothrix sp.]